MVKRKATFALSISASTTAAIAGTVLVTFPVWTVELANIVTPFAVVLFIFLVPALFLGSTIFALVVLGLGIWQRILLAPVPMVIHILSILAFWFVPVDELFYRAEFELLDHSRQTIVDEIEAGERLPNVEHSNRLIHVDGWGRVLSRGGGDVLYEQRDNETFIFFFTYRGIIDNYEGFMYRSGDEQPHRCFFGDTALNIVKMRDHWFWMTCA